MHPYLLIVVGLWSISGVWLDPLDSTTIAYLKDQESFSIFYDYFDTSR